MTEPEVCSQHLPTPSLRRRRGPLAGCTVTVTTGPRVRPSIRALHQQPQLRFAGLGNAESARRAGATVILIAGPGCRRSRADRRRDVTTAQDMYDEVHNSLPATDIFIGVAAVADYRPANAEAQKSNVIVKRIPI